MYVKRSEPPRRLTRAERQAATRAALLDAGARVFIERGFAGASVEAIAEAAGFTRGAFYSNFESREDLFAELLQERVYVRYAEMATRSIPSSLREAGERLAEIQGDSDGRWLFRLWLELLAHAGRDERFRKIAAGFWSGNRARIAALIEARYGDRTPPAAPERIATAMIALDVGLALQHFVDERAAPLDLYPELYELLFEPLSP
jgi:TetR/AcrR family transcriptional regulator, transcriptional repressor of aconitase